MNKPKDFVNYIVVGSRYQVLNEKGEATSEFGVGVFRSGIHLRLAEKIYVRLVDKLAGESLNGATMKRSARELAAQAFTLTEAFLEEIDKHFRRPPPPPPEETKLNSDRFKG